MDEIYKRVSRKAFENIRADSRCARFLARVMSGVCVCLWLVVNVDEKSDLRKKKESAEKNGGEGKWITYREFRASANPSTNICV